MNTSRKFLLLIGFLFLVLAILSVSALAKKPVKPPKPDPDPDPPPPITHEIVYDEGYNFGHVDLMLIDDGGTNKTVLWEGAKQVGFSQPKWSPDGNQIVFACSDEEINGVCTINVDGSDSQQIAVLNRSSMFAYPTYAGHFLTDEGLKLMVLYSNAGDNELGLNLAEIIDSGE